MHKQSKVQQTYLVMGIENTLKASLPIRTDANNKESVQIRDQNTIGGYTQQEVIHIFDGSAMWMLTFVVNT